MTFGERLTGLRKKRGFTRVAFADYIGIPSATLRNYEKDIREPSYAFLRHMTEIFKVSLDYLLCLTDDPSQGVLRSKFDIGDINHIKKYRALDIYGKRAVDSILDVETERMAANNEQVEKVEVLQQRPMHLVAYYQKLASAGTGEYLFDDMIRTQLSILDTEVSRQADFAVGVNGDSMEPEYHDGDIVFVKLQEVVNIGDVGVFILNNESFIKIAGEDRLISLNPEYNDIFVKSNDSFHCVGKVIGKAEFGQ